MVEKNGQYYWHYWPISCNDLTWFRPVCVGIMLEIYNPIIMTFKPQQDYRQLMWSGWYDLRMCRNYDNNVPSAEPSLILRMYSLQYQSCCYGICCILYLWHAGVDQQNSIFSSLFQGLRKWAYWLHTIPLAPCWAIMLMTCTCKYCLVLIFMSSWYHVIMPSCHIEQHPNCVYNYWHI